MAALLSISMWFALLERIMKASHPVILILGVIGLVFAVRGFRARHGRGWWKALLSEPSLLFLLAFALVDLAVRLLPFFAGVPYQDRYFLPLATLVTIFAAKAVLELIPRIHARLKHFKGVTFERVFVACFAGIFLMNTVKALLPHFDKPEVNAVAKTVKRLCPPGVKPVLISSFPDPRYAYYADAQYLSFAETDDLVPGAKLSCRQSGQDFKPVKKLADMRFDAPAEFLLALKNRRVLAPTLEFDWGANPPEEVSVVAANYQKAKPGGYAPTSPPPGTDGVKSWRLLHQGPAPLSLTLPLAKYRLLLITVRPAAGKTWTLNSLALDFSPPWQICAPGVGERCGDWVSIGLPAGLDKLQGNLTKLGGYNVFVLTENMTEEELERAFAAKRAQSPLQLVYSYQKKKGKKTLNLYQFKAE